MFLIQSKAYCAHFPVLSTKLFSVLSNLCSDKTSKITKILKVNPKVITKTNSKWL